MSVFYCHKPPLYKNTMKIEAETDIPSGPNNQPGQTKTSAQQAAARMYGGCIEIVLAGKVPLRQSYKIPLSSSAAYFFLFVFLSIRQKSS